MFIREATKEDAGKIIEIISESLDNVVVEYLGRDVADSIRKYYSEDRINNMQVTFLATDGEKIFGCAAIEKENIFKMFYVKPSYKGIIAAKNLVTHSKTHLKNIGYNTLEADVLESSRNFMTTMGAKDIEKKLEKIDNTTFEVYHMMFEL